MADRERIAIKFWRAEIKVHPFYFFLTLFLCIVSASKLKYGEECVPEQWRACAAWI